VGTEHQSIVLIVKMDIDNAKIFEIPVRFIVCIGSIPWIHFFLTLTPKNVLPAERAIRTSQKECFRGNDPTKCNTKIIQTRNSEGNL
jgi:hypothetical protein